MAWQMWPALSPEDRLRVPAHPPQSYVEYLESLGFELPAFGIEPDGKRIFTPFGWNGEAAEHNLGYDSPSAHPGLSVVARVNSREFTLRLEEEVFSEQARASGVKTFCRDVGELETWLSWAPAGKWVAKGNHGHAGIGQLRIGIPGISIETQANLKRILESQGGLLLEPEHAIDVEFGCLFLVDREGSQTVPRCHRLLSYSGGGFAGALLQPEDPEFLKWKTDIEKAAEAISGRLHREGYFGPVGIDMYAWRDPSGLRFRPLVDLNARCSMAFPVHGLAHRFPKRAILMTQIPSTIALPEDAAELRDRLGALHFDPKEQRGVFLVTPLMPGTRRHAWACVGRDEADVRAMREEVFRTVA